MKVIVLILAIFFILLLASDGTELGYPISVGVLGLFMYFSLGYFLAKRKG